MKFLKKVQELKHEKNSIISLIDTHLSGYEPARSHRIIHASALTSEQLAFCPREIALLDVTKKKQPDKYITGTMRATFDVGDAYSTLVREKWLEPHVVGHWRCDHCGHTVKFSKKPKGLCPKCSHNHYSYEEVVMVVPELYVSGSLDMLVDFKQPKLTMSEIKSIDKDYYEELHAPFAEHRLRTNLYLHLIKMCADEYAKKIDPDRAKILYVSKGYGKKNVEHGFITPFKEFTVERTDIGVAPYIHMLEELAEFRNNRKEYPKRICATPLVTRAKKCSSCKECWSDLPPIPPKDET